MEFSIKEEIQEAVNKDLGNFAVYEGQAAGGCIENTTSNRTIEPVNNCLVDEPDSSSYKARLLT